MPTSDVPRAHLWEEIADRIRQRIQAGALKPGETLPSRAEIAAEFECSVAPVRQALAELDREGWIVARQGKLAIVATTLPK
jgi:GntR family transcriptional regulator